MKKLYYIFFALVNIININAQQPEVARNIVMQVQSIAYENIDNDFVAFPPDQVLELVGTAVMSNTPLGFTTYNLDRLVNKTTNNFTTSGAENLSTYTLFNRQNYCLASIPITYTFTAWEDDAPICGSSTEYNSTCDDSYATGSGTITAATLSTFPSGYRLSAINGTVKYHLDLFTTNSMSRLSPEVATSPQENICRGQNLVINVNTTKSMYDYKVRFGTDTIPVIRGVNTLTITPSALPQLLLEGSFSVEVLEKIQGNCYVFAGYGYANVSVPLPALEPISTFSGTEICTGGSIDLFYIGSTTKPTKQIFWQKNGITQASSICFANSSSCSFTATTAGTYRVMYTNTCGQVNSNEIIITQFTPSISASGSTTLCSGGTVSLAANTGTGITYQWRKDGINISGATTQSYNATSTGVYTCMITNTCGSNVSNTITVSIGSAPTSSITSAGGSTLLCNAASSIVLSANSGSGYTYQWKKDGTNISGATSINYTANTIGTYTCVVSNSCGNVTSNTIVLTQGSLPVASISTPGNNTLICPGSGGVLMTASAGTGYTYVWRKDGINIIGANSISYNATTAGTYSCAITNACGTTSTNKILTEGSIPIATITNTSGVTTICNGNTVLLTASTATGQTYQWKKDGVNIGGSTAQYTYIANAAGTYTCIVTNACGSVTSNSIVLINGNISAAISTSNNTNLCGGSTATLTANAGTGLSYLWYRNAVSTGVNTQSYTVNTAGTYTCVVSNTCGSNTSNAIVITTGLAPVAAISSAGNNTVLCPSASIVLSANTGTGLSYQWYRNGTIIGGATASTYLASTIGNYTCIVSNTCGGTTSNSIGLTTGSSPAASISVSSGTTTLCSSSTVTLSANAGTGLSYQWRKDGVNISGATSQNYNTNVAGIYTCIVTNNCGNTTSNSIAVNILPNNAFTTHPLSQTKNVGQTLNLSVVATGSILSYQWKKDGVNIPLANNSTYTKSGITTADAGNYTCVINGECGGPKTSNIAVVTVIPSTPIKSNTINITGIFPNPSNSFINIKLDIVEQQDIQIDIIDVEGKQIDSKFYSLQNNYQNIHFDISTYANGLYLFNIIAKDGIAYCKFIKN